MGHWHESCKSESDVLGRKSSQNIWFNTNIACLDLAMLLLAYRTVIVFCEDQVKVY